MEVLTKHVNNTPTNWASIPSTTPMLLPPFTMDIDTYSSSIFLPHPLSHNTIYSIFVALSKYGTTHQSTTVNWNTCWNNSMYGIWCTSQPIRNATWKSVKHETSQDVLYMCNFHLNSGLSWTAYIKVKQSTFMSVLPTVSDGKCGIRFPMHPTFECQQFSI